MNSKKVLAMTMVIVMLVSGGAVFAATQIDVKDFWTDKRGLFAGQTNNILINEQERSDTVKKEKAPKAIQEWINQSLQAETLQSKVFDGKTYILITRGQKSTAGYSVKIQSVEEKEKEIVVSYSITEPRPGTFAAQVITYPYDLVSIDGAKGKPVHFVQLER